MRATRGSAASSCRRARPGSWPTGHWSRSGTPPRSSGRSASCTRRRTESRSPRSTATTCGTPWGTRSRRRSPPPTSRSKACSSATRTSWWCSPTAGALLALAGRLAHGQRAVPAARGSVQEPLRASIARFHVDSVAHDPRLLRRLVEDFGTTRVLLGSDRPFDMGDPDPVALVRRAGLDPADEAAVLGDNARRLIARATGGTGSAHAAGSAHGNRLPLQSEGWGEPRPPDEPDVTTAETSR